MQRPTAQAAPLESRPVRIPAGKVTLDGDLSLPIGAQGIIVFAHGSGSSRHSTRNRAVARTLVTAGLGTLLLDLLTPEEDEIDAVTRRLRFDVNMLADRLVATTDWLIASPETRELRIGYFGASTGAAAALMSAARRPERVSAIVSRGGRPDLAGTALGMVHAPTLLIVGGDDVPVILLNRDAFHKLTVEKALEIIPGATHLFEEPGALEEVARLAGDWFIRHLAQT